MRHEVGNRLYYFKGMDKKEKEGEVVRKRPIWCLGGGLSLALAGLVGCAAQSPADKASASGDFSEGSAPAVPVTRSESSKTGKNLEEPSEVDRLLDAKPMVLAVVKPASPGTASNYATTKPQEMASPGKGKFRIQISAESDMDAAQTKKGTYEKQLGGTVDVVFDAPYYKLRWGYFDSKQDAEDKLLELSDQKIQAFVIKQ